MDVLDYIYQNLDSTLAYYDHAGCALGICARCTGRINGKAGLFCQVPVSGDVTLEPDQTPRGCSRTWSAKRNRRLPESGSDPQRFLGKTTREALLLPIRTFHT